MDEGEYGTLRQDGDRGVHETCTGFADTWRDGTDMTDQPDGSAVREQARRIQRVSTDAG